MTKISVIVPTFRRPESLGRALKSVLAQQGAPDFEVVVVDNAPEGGARPVVEALAAGTTIPIVFRHEPRPGVATARNTAWAAASGDLIASIDDDMSAAPDWLAKLTATAERYEADAAFGPVLAQLPESAPADHADFLTKFFSVLGPDEPGLTERYRGCGNSLVNRARAGLGEAPFDTGADVLGGEDDRLFSGMQARGARFAWAADAITYEHVPEARANLRYALIRSFAFGQGPSATAAEHRRYGEMARWMAIGAGQAVVYGAAAAALWAMRSDRRAAMAGRAAEGVGKVFWPESMAPRLYGGAQPAGVQPSSASSGTAKSGSAPAVTSVARPAASGSTDSA